MKCSKHKIIFILRLSAKGPGILQKDQKQGAGSNGAGRPSGEEAALRPQPFQDKSASLPLQSPDVTGQIPATGMRVRGEVSAILRDDEVMEPHSGT